MSSITQGHPSRAPQSDARLERDAEGKSLRLQWGDFRSAPMRAFHLSWFAFFLCFVAWFGIAPLMAVVRDDLKLTKAQIGNTVIASVAITVLARLLAGWLCDRFGPRRTYSALLLLGAFPVMGIGLAHSYQSFLLFRLAIGLIGASFVITQHHTSVMFAPRVVGTANAFSAGWGNLGGGVAQWCMPLLAGAIVGLGADRFLSWRLAMVVPGIGMLLTGILYYRFTEDTPDGRPFAERRGTQAFWEAAADYRVWLLFVLYAACFGVEITIDNVAALYFKDSFHVGLKLAGLLASATGMMNIFARAMGGIAGDWAGGIWGLRGRSLLLGLVVFAEGVALTMFSTADQFGLSHCRIPSVWPARVHGVRSHLRRCSARATAGDRIGFRHCRGGRKCRSGLRGLLVQGGEPIGGAGFVLSGYCRCRIVVLGFAAEVPRIRSGATRAAARASGRSAIRRLRI